jgi:hypothetical protein
MQYRTAKFIAQELANRTGRNQWVVPKININGQVEWEIKERVTFMEFRAFRPVKPEAINDRVHIGE